MDGESQLAELADKLREIPKRASEQIAREAAPELEAEARSTADAGTDAYGQPWARTKDGRAPLENVRGAIHAVVSGTSTAVVTLILRGHYVFHHRGIGKGKGKREAKAGTPARPILPDPRKREVPEGMLDIIRQAAARARARLLGGGS